MVISPDSMAESFGVWCASLFCSFSLVIIKLSLAVVVLIESLLVIFGRRRGGDMGFDSVEGACLFSGWLWGGDERISPASLLLLFSDSKELLRLRFIVFHEEMRGA